MKLKKLLAGILTLAILATMAPTFAVAAGEVPTPYAEGGLDNLVMNKLARLEDDGTYTIILEAFARGSVTTTTIKQVVPADVILILDQSGSMTQETIDGIPTGAFEEANPTNKEVVGGTYYYLAEDGEYYRVTATKELINTSVEWLGQDGNIYTDEELSTYWTASNGNVYNTATPFVTASLKTYTRKTTTVWVANYPHFINDNDTTDDVGGLTIMSMQSLREEFIAAKDTDSTTVSLHNDIPEGVGTSWNEQDPYYVAAVYTAVTKQEVNTYRYAYTYINSSGSVVTIGYSETGTDTALDNAACAINPLYVRGTVTGTRLDALKYAAGKFVDSIRQSALANGVDHRVAMVGFGSDGGHDYTNTELFIGATQYNYAVGGLGSTYNTAGNLASNHYHEAFQSVGTDEGYANLTASVEALAGEGATRPRLGFEMANGIFAANDNTYTKTDGTTGNRSRIVIFLTDGSPGDTGFVAQEASDTVAAAGVSKTEYGAKVYTVAVLDAEPAAAEEIAFLKDTSSDGTYTLATSTAELDDFFQTIDETISSTETSVTLSEHSVVVDQLSKYFVMPDGFSVENNVTVGIAKHAGYEAFLNPTPAGSNIQVAINTDSAGENRGISVTGFNFVSADNLVKTDVSTGGSTVATGNKLVITVSGLLAKDEAVTGSYIDTNQGDFSGIWDADTDGNFGMVKAFPMPKTLLDKKYFVLDYAKDTELLSDVIGIDSTEDGLFSKITGITSLPGSFGSISLADGKTVYSPNTMLWNGYDVFYALSKDTEKGDRLTQNIWRKVLVLPANNVYYEDDFVTIDGGDRVGIVYSGKWDTDGTPAGNSGQSNSGLHGWIDDLSDDPTYSDGSAHFGEAGATATFTFTGSGIDIYSRTNGFTGLVRMQVFNGQGTEVANMTLSLAIDNLAQSGDYYQIPTATFQTGEHGTYTVKLTVGSSSDGRSIYYLDGIRVYNPLSAEQEAEDDVSAAYGDEIAATFTSLRDILIDAESWTDPSDDTANGSVFIDYIPDDAQEGNVTIADVGVYVEYGPKNEVYLAPNHALAFAIGGLNTAVGLKAPEGSAAIQITNGDAVSDLTIGHASDLYYKVTPNSDGYVIIKNVGETLLSITKLKISGDIAVTGISAFSMNEMMTYANTFDSLPVIPYTLEPSAAEPSVPVDPEVPIEPEVPTDPEVPIDPEVPTEPEDPSEPVPEAPVVEEPKPQVPGWLLDLLFNGLKKFFGRP